MKLSPDTIARLRACAETMGISVDELAERCILETLPTIEHEDLMPVEVDTSQVGYVVGRVATGKAAKP